MQMDVTGTARRLGRWLRSPLQGTIWIEYALLAFLVAIGAMGAVQAFGTGVAHLFQHMLTTISSVG